MGRLDREADDDDESEVGPEEEDDDYDDEPEGDDDDDDDDFQDVEPRKTPQKRRGTTTATPATTTTTTTTTTPKSATAVGKRSTKSTRRKASATTATDPTTTTRTVTSRNPKTKTTKTSTTRTVLAKDDDDDDVEEQQQPAPGTENPWTEDGCPVQMDDPDLDGSREACLLPGAAVKACSGSDIYLQKSALKKKKYLAVLPGLLSWNHLHSLTNSSSSKPKPPPPGATQTTTTQEQELPTATPHPLRDAEPVAQSSATTAPPPATVARFTTTTVRVGTVHHLRSDTPVLTLGGTQAANDCSTLRFVGRHRPTSSRFVLLTLHPKRKQRVVCKHVFQSVIAFDHPVRTKPDVDPTTRAGAATVASTHSHEGNEQPTNDRNDHGSDDDHKMRLDEGSSFARETTTAPTDQRPDTADEPLPPGVSHHYGAAARTVDGGTRLGGRKGGRPWGAAARPGASATTTRTAATSTASQQPPVALSQTALGRPTKSTPRKRQREVLEESDEDDDDMELSDESKEESNGEASNSSDDGEYRAKKRKVLTEDEEDNLLTQKRNVRRQSRKAVTYSEIQQEEEDEEDTSDEDNGEERDETSGANDSGEDNDKESSSKQRKTQSSEIARSGSKAGKSRKQEATSKAKQDSTEVVDEKKEDAVDIQDENNEWQPPATKRTRTNKSPQPIKKPPRDVKGRKSTLSSRSSQVRSSGRKKSSRKTPTKESEESEESGDDSDFKEESKEQSVKSASKPAARSNQKRNPHRSKKGEPIEIKSDDSGDSDMGENMDAESINAKGPAQKLSSRIPNKRTTITKPQPRRSRRGASVETKIDNSGDSASEESEPSEEDSSERDLDKSVSKQGSKKLTTKDSDQKRNLRPSRKCKPKETKADDSGDSDIGRKADDASIDSEESAPKMSSRAPKTAKGQHGASKTNRSRKVEPIEIDSDDSGGSAFEKTKDERSIDVEDSDKRESKRSSRKPTVKRRQHRSTKDKPTTHEDSGDSDFQETKDDDSGNVEGSGKTGSKPLSKMPNVRNSNTKRKPRRSRNDELVETKSDDSCDSDFDNTPTKEAVVLNSAKQAAKPSLRNRKARESESELVVPTSKATPNKSEIEGRESGWRKRKESTTNEEDDQGLPTPDDSMYSPSGRRRRGRRSAVAGQRGSKAIRTIDLTDDITL